ncbi:MAG: hypothetical protein KVP17_002194 [Porospora cf. gigantea B]|uniref:uncharacterized protein n=1 Tax=Porospora cf. gigantea B TaxID=2853592 RepID=UPI0035719A52|nr:MAG: hypothetical protein KVP17_002194 [Porospora cf. gigantea B]
MQGPLSRVARPYQSEPKKPEGPSVYTRAADIILDVKALSRPSKAQLERCCNGLQRVMAEMAPHEPLQDELSRVHHDLRLRLETLTRSAAAAPTFVTPARPATPKLSGEAVLWFNRKLFVD